MLLSQSYFAAYEELGHLAQHSQGQLHPAEIVIMAMLHALKKVGQHPSYHWLVADQVTLFPKLPSWARLFHMFNVYHVFAEEFLAAPLLLGITDSYGSELLHPK